MESIIWGQAHFKKLMQFGGWAWGNVLHNSLQIESKPYVAGINLSNIVQQVTFFTIDRSAKSEAQKSIQCLKV